LPELWNSASTRPGSQISAIKTTLQGVGAQNPILTTTPETWYALQLIATGGPKVDRGALTRDLERSRNLDEESVRELLEGLAAEGLISAGTHVELTAEGAAVHRGLRDYIAAPTIRLLSQFDIHDIETTVHTLQAITRRAQEEEEG